jgi:hypothetical protein
MGMADGGKDAGAEAKGKSLLDVAQLINPGMDKETGEAICRYAELVVSSIAREASSKGGKIGVSEIRKVVEEKGLFFLSDAIYD